MVTAIVFHIGRVISYCFSIIISNEPSSSLPEKGDREQQHSRGIRMITGELHRRMTVAVVVGFPGDDVKFEGGRT